GVRRWVTARAVAAGPLVGAVPVDVGGDGRAALVRLPGVAPALVLAGGDVVLDAVRVDLRDDPDLRGVHQRLDLLVGRVVVGVAVDDAQAHLGGQVLARVHVAGEQHLGLVLVGVHVVADLHQRDVPALVGRADRADGHRVAVVLGGLGDLRDHLVVVVVVRVVLREVTRLLGRAELAQLLADVGHGDQFVPGRAQLGGLLLGGAHGHRAVFGAQHIDAGAGDGGPFGDAVQASDGVGDDVPGSLLVGRTGRTGEGEEHRDTGGERCGRRHPPTSGHFSSTLQIVCGSHTVLGRR